MRIAIDAYSLAGQTTGIGVYVYNIVKQLERIDEENEYFLYTPSDIQLPLSFNRRWHICITKGLFNKSGTFWKQTQAKKEILRNKIEIFWAPNAILPLGVSTSIKTVLTVNDLTCIYYPHTLNWDNRIIFPLFFKKSLKKADRIIAISETTAKGINKLVGGIDKKLDIVYYGRSREQFRPSDRMQARDYISLKFKTSSRYILAVVTIEPRKNLENLLKAYAELLKHNKGFDYQLLIVGGKGWKNSHIYRTYKELKFTEDKVKFVGYVPYDSQDMAKLYSGAAVFVFPSLYEGFGLPSLEAMACGTGVVASDIPVFREILSDAAFFVNPNDPESISTGIYKMLTDTDLSGNLMQKGFARVKLFSWGKAAQETLRVFSKAQ